MTHTLHSGPTGTFCLVCGLSFVGVAGGECLGYAVTNLAAAIERARALIEEGR